MTVREKGATHLADKFPLSRLAEKKRLLLGVFIFLMLSAAMAYWIVHTSRWPEGTMAMYEIQKFDLPKASLGSGTWLDDDNSYFCPICGERVKLDRHPLTMGLGLVQQHNQGLEIGKPQGQQVSTETK